MNKVFSLRQHKPGWCWLTVAIGILLFSLPLKAQTDSIAKKRAEQVRNIRTMEKIHNKTPKERLPLQRKAKSLGLVYREEKNGHIRELQGFLPSGLPIYYETRSFASANTTGVTQLWSEAEIFQLDGRGMTVHQWDGGAARTTHQEFGNRVTKKDGGTVASHPTAVAGVMISSGVDPQAKGMAPRANLWSYDWNSDIQEMEIAYDQGAILGNGSYGSVTGWSYNRTDRIWEWYGDTASVISNLDGVYSYKDARLDLLHCMKPNFLFVNAAGNSRGDGPDQPAGTSEFSGVRHRVFGSRGERLYSTRRRQKNGGSLGYDCIGHGSTAKNMMVVGAVEKIVGGYQQPSDVRLASFSSTGPTDDGRIKPDIVAVGVDVHTTEVDNDQAYTNASGTSFAAPNTTGALLLLQQLYKRKNHNNPMKSATVKALVINTAHEAGPAPGPDYQYGWGLLNAYGAARAIDDNRVYSLVKEDSLYNNRTKTYTVTAKGEEPLKVTIAWTDPYPGNVDLYSERTNDRTARLVNDLDLRITQDNNTYYPWHLDVEHPSRAATKADNTLDNVEQVVIDNPTAGATYTITVSHKGRLKKQRIDYIIYGDNFEDADFQAFSLVATGIQQSVDRDASIESIVLPQGEKAMTRKTTVRIKVKNNGTEHLNNIRLEAYRAFDDDSSRRFDEQALTIDALNAGESKTFDMIMDLSAPKRSTTITAKIILQDSVVGNNIAKLTVLNKYVDLSTPGSRDDYGFEVPFDQKGWTKQDVGDDRWDIYTQDNIHHNGEHFGIQFGTRAWLFSSGYRVKAGHTYKVALYENSLGYEGKFQIKWGLEPNSAAMTHLDHVKTLANRQYEKDEFTLTFPNDTIIYFGYNLSEGDYAFAVDDWSIEHLMPSITVNETNFPDANFRNYLAKKFNKTVPFDITDAMMQDDKTSFDLSTEYDGAYKEVNSLKGIELLANLTSLNVSGSHLTSLNVSDNIKLTRLIVNDAKLSSLDLSQNKALTYLEAKNNYLSALNLDNTAVALGYYDVTGNKRKILVDVTADGKYYIPVSKLATYIDAATENVSGEPSLFQYRLASNFSNATVETLNGQECLVIGNIVGDVGFDYHIQSTKMTNQKVRFSLSPQTTYTVTLVTPPTTNQVGNNTLLGKAYSHFKSMASPVQLRIEDNDVDIFTVTVKDDGMLRINKLNGHIIPAYTGVILAKQAENPAPVPLTLHTNGETVSAVTNNDLIANITPRLYASGSNNNYYFGYHTLTAQDGGEKWWLGFYRASDAFTLVK